MILGFGYNRRTWCSVIVGVNDEAIWNKHRDELTRYASMLVARTTLRISFL